MRRPYMVGGAIGSLAGATLMGTALNIPQLFVGWLVLQFSANAAITTFLAVIADKVPASQRGIASGFSGMCRTLVRFNWNVYYQQSGVGLCAAGLYLHPVYPYFPDDV